MAWNSRAGPAAVERRHLLVPEGRHEPAELGTRGRPGGLSDRRGALAADQLGQQLDHRGVGQHLLALGHAVADDDLDAAGLQARGELVDDPGLADARRALDEDGPEPVTGHDLVDQ